MQRVLRWSVTLPLVLAAAAAAAQALPVADPEKVGMSSERLERIEQVFQAEIDKGELPGAVIMVARHGHLVYSAALGQLEGEGEEAMPEDAIFRIYSMTKPLTSVAAMILMEEGALQLTDPVAKFLPAFADLEVSVMEQGVNGEVSYSTVPAARPMTVQDLLRHTSGLVYGELTQNELVRDGYAEAGAFNPTILPFDSRHVSGEEQVAGLAQVPLGRQPGTMWEYSFSTDVLGRVVEAVSGQRLGEFLEERVFAPLGMVDSGFYVPENAMSRLVEPFAVDPGMGQPIELMDVSQPPANDSGGAGAVSTAADYLRFTQMLLNGGELDGARILSPTTVQLMASDHLGTSIEHGVGPGQLLIGTPGYTFGLGFGVRQQDGIAAVPGSAGEYMWAGYGGTYFWVDPDEQLTAVLMTQRAGPTRAYYRRHIKQLVHQAIVDAPEQQLAAE
jgi:CubicO group peptidase (beta-lactamase class C family)